MHPSTPDPLDAFPTEGSMPAATGPRTAAARTRIVGIVALGAVVVAAVIGAWLQAPSAAGWVRRLVSPPKDAPAALVIETSPAGWEVLEGGRNLGTTPFRGTMAPGRHAVVLRRGNAERGLDVVLAPGAQVFHHLDLRSESSTGTLSISTSPPGAIVEVDGVRRGTAPLDVSDLAPGEHTVALRTGEQSVTERVTVRAGLISTLLVPVEDRGSAAPGVGFVAITAPIELQVYDGASLVGSSRNERIILMPGRRSLRLANAQLGFERTTSVDVQAGAVARLSVPVPNGVLSVNATPWAEVVLDGVVIGETPIANHAVPLGSHEVLLRNPRFPEQRRTVIVSLTAPARVGVDLRQ
jgi:hypothetical protein